LIKDIKENSREFKGQSEVAGSEHTIKIAGMEIKPPLLLAPMAGLTHSAFRRLVTGFGGAGLLFSEMLSARSLPHENPAISPYLIRTEDEYPLAYQLLVSDPDEIEPAVDAIRAMAEQNPILAPQAIDINMGCTAPQIRRRGAGCALLLQQEKAAAIVSTLKKAAPYPVTVKIRLFREKSWDRLSEKSWLVDFCKAMEQSGADLLTLHARFVGEPFSRPPSWELAAELLSYINIPYVINGGIDSPTAARKALQLSGAAGLMVGRAAVQKPWLLAEIASEVFQYGSKPEEFDLAEIYFSLFTHLKERFPEERVLGRLKEFTHYFSRNFLFGHTLASGVQKARSTHDAVKFARFFFMEHGIVRQHS